LGNKLKLDLGSRTNGKRVEDVKLPNWALSADDFLKKNRQALESEYVDMNLHKWLDLIFGCYQNSLDHYNVFHPMTYEGSVNLDKIKDPIERQGIEVQISEFGQTPRQLFRKEHPQKYSKIIPKTLCVTFGTDIGPTESKQTIPQPSQMIMGGQKEEVKGEGMDSDSQSTKQSTGSMKQEASPDEIKPSIFKELTSNFKFEKLEKVHKDQIRSITCVVEGQQNPINHDDPPIFIYKYVTTSMDGFIKMIDINEKEVKKAFFVN